MPLLQDYKQYLSRFTATRIVVSIFGILVGLAGIEHGLFEILQGNVIPTEAPIGLGLDIDAFGFGYIIDAIGPSQKIWPSASEPAFTLVPNFFLTGILAVILGIAYTIWAGIFVERRFGASILFILSITLFFFGGGFGPISLGILTSITATEINKPLNLWRSFLPARSFISRLWPWTVITFVLVFIISVDLAVLGYPFRWFFDASTTMFLWDSFAMIMLLFIPIAIITAFAYDIENSER